MKIDKPLLKPAHTKVRILKTKFRVEEAVSVFTLLHQTKHNNNSKTKGFRFEIGIPNSKMLGKTVPK